jgi:hypothetical protein
MPSVQQYLYLKLLGNDMSNMRGGYNLISVSKRIVNSTETGVLSMKVVCKESFVVLMYFATEQIRNFNGGTLKFLLSVRGWDRSKNGYSLPLRLDYGRSPHAYVNQRLQIQLKLLMVSGMPLETL